MNSKPLAPAVRKQAQIQLLFEISGSTLSKCLCMVLRVFSPLSLNMREVVCLKNGNIFHKGVIPYVKRFKLGVRATGLLLIIYTLNYLCFCFQDTHENNQLGTVPVTHHRRLLFLVWGIFKCDIFDVT